MYIEHGLFFHAFIQHNVITLFQILRKFTLFSGYTNRKENFMGTTQPIREKDDLQLFLNYYKTEVPSERNYTLIVLGLNTILRISDILHLQWHQLYDFEKKDFHSHLSVYEQKTGKPNTIILNAKVKDALTLYMNSRTVSPYDYVFTKNTSPQTPLSRSQAYRIIRRAAEETLHQDNISCHSLRKTFGYHAWKQGTPPALLMNIYNHSSYHITKRYLGIEQDEKDAIFLNIDI